MGEPAQSGWTLAVPDFKQFSAFYDKINITTSDYTGLPRVTRG